MSPVADDLIAQVESKASAKTAANGKKRKATTTDVKVTKRTTKGTATDIKTEDIVDGTDESPQPKRRMTKKIKVDEDTVSNEVKVEANGNGATKVTQKTTVARKKKQVDLAPLAERTADTKLRVGAHVSAAGG